MYQLSHPQNITPIPEGDIEQGMQKMQQLGVDKTAVAQICCCGSRQVLTKTKPTRIIEEYV